MKAYVNYPEPHFTIHWNDRCPGVQKNRKEGQRVITITPETLDVTLSRFINREFTFAANPDENDMWLDVALGSPQHNEAIVYVVQLILGRRYRPLKSASVETHTCPDPH